MDDETARVTAGHVSLRVKVGMQSEEETNNEPNLGGSETDFKQKSNESNHNLCDDLSLSEAYAYSEHSDLGFHRKYNCQGCEWLGRYDTLRKRLT